MKKYVLLSVALLFAGGNAFSQELYPSQIPSVIRNSFQNSFPEAKDIEWEKEGANYKVEFEIGFWNDDHKAWYNNEGQLTRHKEEMAKKDLPKVVTAAIDREFKWYWITDVKKITRKDSLYYQIELWTFFKEWDMMLDASGRVIAKSRD